ncbi:MAG: hypothetical protein PWP47_1706 [Synergistaceae bacterium]|nr:hypothetical protein [Synergistaceae bacterium]
MSRKAFSEVRPYFLQQNLHLTAERTVKFPDPVNVGVLKDPLEIPGGFMERCGSYAAMLPELLFSL